MKFNRLVQLALICAIAMVALFGCSSAATPTTESAAPTAASNLSQPTLALSGSTAVATEVGRTYKVAMVTSGPTNDHGWNQQALEGVQQIQEKLGWDMAYSENVAAAQQQNVLRQYAQQGYDLIFVHGYEWGDALTAVAPDFPNVMFAQINATTAGNNIVGTNFKYGELGYFAGMAAGLMTKNNMIGVVAAEDAPQVTADSDNISVGALAVNPDAEVNVSFVGSWDDVVKGQQVAQAQIDRGVDVLVIMGDAFTPPAIKLAQENGVKVIGGWSGDNYPLAPDTVITSGVQDIPGVYMEVAQQFLAGKLEGNTTFISGFAEGTQKMGQWGDFVPQDVKDQVQAAIDDYLAGTLKFNVTQ